MAVGETVDVGTVMAKIATDAKPGEAHVSENGVPETGTGEATAALEAPGEAGELSGDTTDEHAGTAQPRPRRDGSRRYSPVVMRIAAEHDVDLEQVEGTGRGGRVRKQDVLAFIESGPKEEPPMHIESPYRPDEPAAARKPRPRLQRVEEVPKARRRRPAGAQKLSRMRQAIGSRMVQSLQTAATCTTIAEADMSRIEAARKAAGFSYLPYQARATIETLLEFPALNATLEDDQHTVYTDAVHLGIAVSLGEGGLIVPIIRDAQDLSVEGCRSGSRTSRRAPALEPADAGRGQRRHVHDHEPGPVRLADGHAGDQPAAGRDPRHRGGRQAPGGGHRRARQRLDRDPPHDVSVHVAGTTARSTARSRRNSCRHCARSWRAGRLTRPGLTDTRPGASCGPGAGQISAHRHHEPRACPRRIR